MEEHKICCTCKQKLHKEQFPKNKKGKLGVHSKCKECFKEYRKLNKNKATKITKKTCNKCSVEKSILEFEKRSAFKDGYDCSCKECRRGIKTFTNKKCNTCNSVYTCEPYKSTKQKIKKCKSCTKERNNNYRREYVKKNKASWAVRNVISQSFIRAFKGQYKKSDRTEELLGCTIQEAINYIETTFKEGMSWENHGRCKDGSCENVWHIDHKIPLDSAKTEEELVKLCYYTNLQALWAFDNLSKNSQIIS